MWYTKVGKFFKRFSSWGVYFAVILSLVNALFIKNEQGKYTFEYGSIKAILNFVFFFVIVGLAILQKYFRDKEKVSSEQKRRQQLDDFCEIVFSTLKLDHKYRVSIFEMPDDCLVVTGRFSRFASHPISEVKFKSNMGCVGIAYYSGAKHVIDDLPDFQTCPDDYYAKMKKHGNMDRELVDKLHRKNGSYFSYPIKYFNSQKVASVMCIDCTESKAFTTNKELIEQVDDIISPLLTTLFKLTDTSTKEE